MNQSTAPRKAERLVAVKGMNDILPPESARWEALEACVRTLMRRYAYESIRTPIVEPTALFVRGLGEITDSASVVWPFHCVSIADGSRTIEVGQAVMFRTGFRVARPEAVSIRSV